MSVVRLLSALALCLGVTLPGIALAQDMNGLIPMQRRGEILGWEAVGRVDLPGGMCTGVLIAPDVALTAAHCVYDARGDLIPARGILFRAGYYRGQSMADRRVAAVYAHPNYVDDISGRVSGASMVFDVALLRLAAPISSSEAEPFGIFDGTLDDLPVTVVSYGNGRSEYLSRQSECAVLRRYAAGQIVFDCNVTYGSSGAPVFARTQGRIRILALVSAIAEEQDVGRQGESYGMALPERVAELKALMRRDDALPKVTTGARRVQVGQRMTAPGGARFVRP